MSTRPDSQVHGSEHDPLLVRYREASETDKRQPAAAVREAVLKAAALDAEKRRQDSRHAANDSYWNWRAVAGIAVIGLAGLLFLQFERASVSERDILMSDSGRPGMSTGSGQGESALPPAKEDKQKSTFASAPGAEAVQAPAPANDAASMGKPAEAIGQMSMARRGETPEMAKRSINRNAELANPPSIQDAQDSAVPAPAPAPVQSKEAASVLAEAEVPAKPKSESSVAASAPAAPAALATSAAAVASPSTPAERARRTGPEALERWMQHGGDPNERNEDGLTLLMQAAKSGRLDLVERLLAAGADRQLKDPKGLTASDHARQAGHDAIVQRLSR